MDLIYESYQEAVLTEAFKSKVLTQIYKAAANKKTVARYWDKDKADEDGMIPDKNFIDVMKQQIGSMVKQLDLANVPDNAVVVVPKEDLKKKANKKAYRNVIFTDDNNMPIYFGNFWDDGTINYVTVVGRYQLRGEADAKLSHVMADPDVKNAVVIIDFENYMKLGADKSKARYASKTDAVALQTEKEALEKNLDRYKTILAKRKAENPEVQKVQDNMIKAFSAAMQTYASFDMAPGDFQRYGDNKILKFLTQFEKQIAILVGAIDDAKKKETRSVYFGGDYGKKLGAELIAAKQWLAKANKFVRTGEL
jgi:hypothetical protein